MESTYIYIYIYKGLCKSSKHQPDLESQKCTGNIDSFQFIFYCQHSWDTSFKQFAHSQDLIKNVYLHLFFGVRLRIL